jgi:Tfp pilus assembly protein PilF
MIIGGMKASDRDLGLAYAQEAVRGDRHAAGRALQLLRKAEEEPGSKLDYELHEQLGFLEQLNGDNDQAVTEYRQALIANPYGAVAAGDLAVIAVKKHQIAEALQLWKGVMKHDPAEVGAGLNLALVEIAVGNQAEARVALEQVLRFDPDNDRARALKAELDKADAAH